MLKNKCRFLVFCLVMCLSSISAFANQGHIEKIALKPNEKNILLDNKVFLSSSAPNIPNKVFWSSSDNLLLKSENQANAGPVIAFGCYVLCRGAGGSVSTCIAACTVALLL